MGMPEAQLDPDDYWPPKKVIEDDDACDDDVEDLRDDYCDNLNKKYNV